MYVDSSYNGKIKFCGVNYKKEFDEAYSWNEEAHLGGYYTLNDVFNDGYTFTPSDGGIKTFDRLIQFKQP